MKINYLIVTEWKGPDIANQYCWDKVRRVEATGHKADQIGARYQLELNKGVDYEQDANLIKAIKENLVHYTVCAIPMSQAREYNNFFRLEKSPIYK